MLVVVAEVETGEQRHQPGKVVRSGPVVVSETLFLQPVRAPGSEIEQLKRREDRGDGIEGEDRPRRHDDADEQDEHRAGKPELPPAEIVPHEADEPRHEAVRMVGVEVRIVRRARAAVVAVVIRQQAIVGEGHVEREAEVSDEAVHPRPARRQRAVHAVVRDDEEADEEPRREEDRGRREPDRRRAPVHHEEAQDLHGAPRPDDEGGEREADRGLDSAVAAAASKLICVGVHHRSYIG